MDILTKSKGPEVLITLLEGPKPFTALHQAVGGSLSTVQDRVEELIEAKRVKDEWTKSWPFTRTLSLTQEGRRIARIMRFMKEFLDPSKLSEGKRWMIATLHTHGEVRGSIRLQKLHFLLKEELKAPVGSGYYDFTWYIHGPYSKLLADDANALELWGLLQVDEEELGSTEEGGEKILRVYRLTPQGEEVAKLVLTNLPTRGKLAIKSLERFNQMPLKSLLKYVYSKYGSNRQEEAHA